MFPETLSVNTKKWLSVFILSFVVSVLLLGVRWSFYPLLDANLWSDQTQYVLNGDAREFDSWNYGHPGGPIIEGAALVQFITGASFKYSVVLFVTFFCGIIISGICLLCLFLKRDDFWWMAVLGNLSISWLYQYATPPSVIATLLVTFLCLLTLYIFENYFDVSIGLIYLWAVAFGLLVATRIDIGVFTSVFFLLFLMIKIKWKEIRLIAVTAFVSFVAFDPFMWFVPVRHIKDLIGNVIYHYSDCLPERLDVYTIIAFSFLTIVSIVFSVFYMKSKQLDDHFKIPHRFLAMLIVMSLVLYMILLNAQYKAERYFMPVLFIWETFLPLFIFSLIQKTSFTFLPVKDQERAVSWVKIFIIILFFISNLVILYQNIFVYDLMYI